MSDWSIFLIDGSVDWFFVWLYSQLVIYVLENIFDWRQLRKFFVPDVPKPIEAFIDQEEFSKC